MGIVNIELLTEPQNIAKHAVNIVTVPPCPCTLPDFHVWLRLYLFVVVSVDGTKFNTMTQWSGTQNGDIGKAKIQKCSPHLADAEAKLCEVFVHQVSLRMRSIRLPGLVQNKYLLATISFIIGLIKRQSVPTLITCIQKLGYVNRHSYFISFLNLSYIQLKDRIQVNGWTAIRSNPGKQQFLLLYLSVYENVQHDKLTLTYQSTR